MRSATSDGSLATDWILPTEWTDIDALSPGYCLIVGRGHLAIQEVKS